MLRYFYILVCIQLCFSTDYTDHSDIYNYERKIRSKNVKLHKKNTRSPNFKTKKSRVVQFDVENFMQAPDEPDNEYEPYSYRRRYDRRASEKYGEEEPYIESTEITRTKKLVDFSIEDNAVEVTTRAAPKDTHDGRKHFNIHSMSFEEKSDAKATHHPLKSSVSNVHRRKYPAQKSPHHEAKCSFKSMRIPFFSYSKSTEKSNRREKKKRMFCFNCHKTTTNSNQLESNPDVKADDKDQSSKDKIEKREFNKVSKRSYGNFCPKCIRDLLNSIRGKKSKDAHKEVTTAATPSVQIKDLKSPLTTTTTIKPNLDKPEHVDTNLQGDYNYLNRVRIKRNEEEDKERERRIKELEEVERKIANVHVTAPTFTRVSLNIEN